MGQVEITIPLGYVLTEEGHVAYELGKPLSQATMSKGGYSLEGISKRVRSDSATALLQRQGGGVTVKVEEEEDPNIMLVRLGATTGLLLAGATAVNMLSHHLTVNVFWV